MRTTLPSLFAVAVLATSGVAAADQYPYVVKGPVITGVTDSEAWVSWYTSHHQGTSSFLNECYNDALTGTPNDEIPTLEVTSGDRIDLPVALMERAATTGWAAANALLAGFGLAGHPLHTVPNEGRSALLRRLAATTGGDGR